MNSYAPVPICLHLRLHLQFEWSAECVNFEANRHSTYILSGIDRWLDVYLFNFEFNWTP